MARNETIESSGYPLAFKVRQGRARPAVIAAESGRDVFLAEARQIGGHQKECVVHEGTTGSAFRAVSDEGAQLKGTDLAPFPLGFYNAGLSADLVNRVLATARARAITFDWLEVELHNRYSMTGSFFQGTGVGAAEPARIKVGVSSSATRAQIDALVQDAGLASPALATMRVPLLNTFALYVNGRRRLTRLPPSQSPDAADPFVTYRKPPAPLDGASAPRDLVYKTGQTTQGEFVYQAAETKGRVVIDVSGHCRLLDPAGVTETVVRLGFPRTSHFAIRSDERGTHDIAPSGLSLATSGIVFCYITQLLRYIEHQKLNIRGVRVVQASPYTLAGTPAGQWRGGAEPVDTHLFLNGKADEDTCETLMTVAARTCYLHAALGATLPPEIVVEHGEQAAA